MTELYAYVGRQAIFAPDLKVAAYELLYRDSMENRAKFDDVDRASASTMFNAIVEHGLDALVGDLPVYVNLPAGFLLGKYPIPLDPSRAILEVLEDVPVTDELIAALRGFKSRGYRIALDDFIPDERTQPLVPLADVIKLDVLNVAHELITERVAALRNAPGFRAQILAEKVATPEELAWLRTLDFDFYQGFFLAKPIVSRARRLPHDRATLLQLLAKLYDPQVNMRELDTVLARDVGLSVRILRLAGSAAFARGSRVGTVSQAVQLLGTQQLAALVVIAMVSGFHDKPLELLVQSLVRARMCELVAKATGIATPDQLFTAGLLSLLDVILDQPLEELLKQLPMTPLISDALAGAATPAAQVVAAARAQERCAWDDLTATGVPADVVGAAWRSAVVWTRELLAQL